ncbi:MAG: WecB/TagA/CpsF family glycosyltransferase, partial [Patescibacteria group bacterium]
MKNLDFDTSITERKYGKIFNIDLDSTSEEKVLACVRDSLARGVKFSIVTPNPEIILEARRDKKLLALLNNASLAIPDGIGLSQAAKFLSLAAPKNILLRMPVCFLQGICVGLATFLAKDWIEKALPVVKGRKLFMEVIKLANKKGWRVFFFGGEHGEAQASAERLQRSLKRIKIAHAAGPRVDNRGKSLTEIDAVIEKDCIRQINEFKPHILFVAFNTPKQEKWLFKWLPSLDIGGGMVVGGTFRYISGQAKLTPKWMEEYGLEWLWRLITEPWRIKRVLIAFPVFPLKVFLYK